jgi:CheY-like chemotaxis protein
MNRSWILVVDDSPDAQAFYGACLEPSGYDVVFASDGSAALRATLDRAPPSVIVLDLLMPEMDGYEFLGILQAYKRLARVPVLVVTAAAWEHEARTRQGLVLQKPITPARLLDALRSVVAS